ncbi:hypothetical protein SAMN04488142_0016 [Halomonas sp. hl-4]|nr:hypothetical protein SAMN04488142_0016 [Halomonas sp. hl-4]
MKRKPSGFVAKCQCGQFTGALSLAGMENKDAGKLLGKWLYDGCTVEPRFGGTWSESIKPCLCEKAEVNHD